MKTDPFTYNLYHLPHTTDLEAHLAYDALYPRVRAVAGILWVAHNHGTSGPAYLVVALPTRTNPESREELVGNAGTVATLSDAELIDRIDTDLAALLPEAEAGEDDDDGVWEGPDDDGGPDFDPYAGEVIFEDGGDNEQ